MKKPFSVQLRRYEIIGGLISTKEQVEKGFRAGAIAASTGQSELWN